MKKFTTIKDFLSSTCPAAIAAAIRETLDVLDRYYGSNRTDANLGGFVLIPENCRDLEQITDILHEPIEEAIPELVDEISSKYLKSVYIINPDFSITVIFRTDIAPEILKKYINK